MLVDVYIFRLICSGGGSVGLTSVGALIRGIPISLASHFVLDRADSMGIRTMESSNVFIRIPCCIRLIRLAVYGDCVHLDLPLPVDHFTCY